MSYDISMNGYTEWQIAGMAGIIAVLCFIPYTWKFLMTHFITLAHEYGHAFLGVFTEGSIHKIKIHLDSSGETSTYRERKFIPVGSVLTTLAGYPAPILLGSFLITSVDETWRPWSAVALLIFGLFCLLFIRNLFGLVMALIWVGLFGSLVIFNPTNLNEITMVAGMVFLIGGVKDMLTLCRMWFKKDADGSDLGILKEAVHFPQVFSLMVMIAISVVGSWVLLSM